MLNRILSFLYVSYFFLSSAFFVCVAATLCLLCKNSDPNRRLVHRFSCWWGYHYIAVNPFWKCSFEGLDLIEADKAYVLAANHQSFWDIMVLYGLNKHYKWVSKESIFKVPFIGWNMELNQYVKIARGDLKSIKEMMNTCKSWLKKGSSMMIFPEGTRSPDGELLEFRDGPFKMAIDCGVPVVPVVLDGTYKMLPKGSSQLDFNASVRVKVLPPIDASIYSGNAKALRDHVRDLMSRELESMRGKPSQNQTAGIENNAACITEPVSVDPLLVRK